MNSSSPERPGGPSEAEGEGGRRARHGLSPLFLLLILCQAAHSVEEYLFRLYDVFAPARYLSTMLGLPPPLGFAIDNILLVLFGLWCWFARVRHGRPGARGLAWFWALLETANGFGHISFALAVRGYFPGLATAPLLLGLGAYLVVRLVRTSHVAPAQAGGLTPPR